MFNLTNTRQEVELEALMKMAVMETAVRGDGDGGGGDLLLLLLLGRLGVVGDEALVEQQPSRSSDYDGGAAAALREEAMEIDSLG